MGLGSFASTIHVTARYVPPNKLCLDPGRSTTTVRADLNIIPLLSELADCDIANVVCDLRPSTL